MLEGRCCCGFVHYRAGGAPSNETNCHCSLCRRTSGAVFLSWFTVPRTEFRFVGGEPARFQSSEHGTRTFCLRCGTALTFQSTRFPDEVDVTIGSLDEPERVSPKDDTHTDSKVAWVAVDDRIPAFAGARPEEEA
jgi:hypothetical protein